MCASCKEVLYTSAISVLGSVGPGGSHLATWKLSASFLPL